MIVSVFTLPRKKDSVVEHHENLDENRRNLWGTAKDLPCTANAETARVSVVLARLPLDGECSILARLG